MILTRKLIFLDIDGTLTEPGKNIPPASALDAIQKARANGHKVLLCTGRNRGMLSPLLQFDWDGYIGSAGGYIVCDDRVIFDCPMTEEQRVRVLGCLEKNGIFRTVECLDNSYTDEAFKDFLRDHASEGGNSELLRWRQQIEESLGIQPMGDYQGDPCYKVVIMIPEHADLEAVRHEIGDDFQVVIQEGMQASFRNGEVINRKFDKGSAVKAAAEFYGIPIEDTIAFGDSMNDLEMIETAGFSICMENGAQALKDLADEVCPTVTDNGIYQAFAKHGLL